jgi:tryptophan synthase
MQLGKSIYLLPPVERLENTYEKDLWKRRAFHAFIEDPSVRLVGVEAGGSGIDDEQQSASLSKGSRGIMHGSLTYVLQDGEAGRIYDSRSIAAGLDYPAVGPELAWLKESGRAEFCAATDFEAIQGIKICLEFEHILPAIESAHAVNKTIHVAKELGKSADVVLVRLSAPSRPACYMVGVHGP